MKYIYAYKQYSEAEYMSDDYNKVEEYALNNCEVTHEGEGEDGNIIYGCEFSIYRQPLEENLVNIDDNNFYEVVMTKDGKVLSYEKHEYM